MLDGGDLEVLQRMYERKLRRNEEYGCEEKPPEPRQRHRIILAQSFAIHCPTLAYNATKLQSRYQAQARERLRAAGARITAPRVKVFAVLLGEGRALSHQEVLKRAGRLRGLDRVTVYRVLELLERYGLVHKLADEERPWRFIAGNEHMKEHAHFKCERCAKVICLGHAAVPPKLKLPAGYRPTKIDLTVRGVCATCRPRG